MWSINEKGQKEFKGNKSDWAEAATAAAECRYFTSDVVEELVADEEISCYNCRYRRWTAKSFVCLKSGNLSNEKKLDCN